MAVAYDAITNFTSDTTSPMGGNHTCTGDNRVLFVVLTYHKSTALTSIACTYNTVGMTNIATFDSGYHHHVLFRLANPASGANAVSISWTGTPTETYAHAISVNAADITGTPERTVYTASSTSNPSNSGVTVADAVAGDMILDFGCWSDATTGTLTPPSGATERATHPNGTQSQWIYTEVVASTGSQAQAFSVNTTTTTSHFGFAVKGIAGGGQFICWSSGM